MAARGIFSDWFRPERFYRRGVPAAVHTAIELLPDMRRATRALLRKIAPRRALEIGPGEWPLLDEVPEPVYLDIASVFCAPLRPRAVQGHALALPFRDAAFDLVLAADLLTHIAPARRADALAEMARVAPRIVLFVPEPGTPEVHGSAVWTESVVGALEALGFTVERYRYHARRRDGGLFPMELLRATRLGVEPALPEL